jgi:flagellar assembly protein FliH
MTVQHLLEDFGDIESDQLVLSDQALEEQRLEAFERGYQAGWEDSTKAHAQEQSHIGAELARNLQDLSFTLQEAQTAVLRNLEPLFRALSRTILPDAARAALDGRLIEELNRLTREVGGGTIVVSVATSQAERVSALLARDQALNVSVQDDETLGDGQAFIRVGERERMIDLESAVEDIRRAIDTYCNTSEEGLEHG